MARAKKVTEEVKEPEVIETPVADVVENKPKKSRKKKVEEPVEEVVVEEPAPVVEEPIIEPEPIVETPIVEPEPAVEEVKVEEPVVEEVKPAPVKAKKVEKVEEPAATSSYKVITTRELYVLRLPGRIDTKIGSYKAGIKFDIIEEYKGWGKIADRKWVNLNYVEKI